MFALPPPLPDEVARTPVQAAESLAVVEIFHQGCEVGQLRLPASRARLLRESEIPSIANVFPFLRKTRSRKVFQFSYPPKTYLALAEFDESTRRSIVRTCTVVSKAITTSDASAALTWNIPKKKGAAPRWIPNMYLLEWTYDRPDLGYRKRMRIRDDKSVIVEVALYGDIPRKQMPSENRK